MDDYYFRCVKSPNIPSTIESAPKRKLDIIHVANMARACPEQAYRMRAFRCRWVVNGSPPNNVVFNYWHQIELAYILGAIAYVRAIAYVPLEFVDASVRFVHILETRK